MVLKIDLYVPDFILEVFENILVGIGVKGSLAETGIACKHLALQKSTKRKAAVVFQNVYILEEDVYQHAELYAAVFLITDDT